MHHPEQDMVNQEEPASETGSKKPNPASSTDPVHHSLWEKHSLKSSGRLNMSTWDNPWLVGGSQEVLLQGVLSHQLVMQLTALCFSTSEAGLAEQIPHMTSTTMWELPYACKHSTHSRPGAGGSNWTFQRQRHTFLFPAGFTSLAGVRKMQPCKQTIVPACWAACPFWQASLTLQIEPFVKDRHVAEYNSSLAHILNGYSRIKHHVSF